MEVAKVKSADKAKKEKRTPVMEPVDAGMPHCDCPLDEPSLKCRRCFVKVCRKGTVTIPVITCTHIRKVSKQNGRAHTEWGRAYETDSFPSCSDDECKRKEDK